MHLEWIDDQPNVLHQQPCDQRATIDNRTVYVRYDYPGRSWFIYIEPPAPQHSNVSTRSHPTRDAARSYAEGLLNQRA